METMDFGLAHMTNPRYGNLLLRPPRHDWHSAMGLKEEPGSIIRNFRRHAEYAGIGSHSAFIDSIKL